MTLCRGCETDFRNMYGVKYICNLYYVLIYHLLLLCSYLHDCQALHKPTGLTYTYTERTDVHFTNIIYAKTEVRERRSAYGKRRTTDRLPNTLNAHFSVDDKNVDLRLYKNSKLSLDVPIYYHNATGITRHLADVPITSAFYQDVDNKASFHVECLNNIDGLTCTELELFGTFYIEDEFYILESETVSSSNYSDLANTTRPYNIYQPRVPLQFVNDHSNTEPLRGRSSPYSSTGRSKRATGRYTVELFVVTDYSVYKFWYDASTQTTNQGKRNDAINKIRTFVGFHINGIDARYESLLNAGFTIDVTFAGLYIAESAASSSWTETVKTDDGTVNVKTVINNFRLWVQSENQAGNIPEHDHAMLFSRYDFTSNGNSDNIGYAYQGAMCTPTSQSIVEDQFNFIVETTAAHELGHSFGAKHDGIDNECLADNTNIMSASSSAQTGNKARNPWIFSSCSAIEINSLLDNLNRNVNNCLLTTNSQTNPNELDPYLATEIGQMFDVNQQCVEAIGQGSYMCLQLYTDFETICTGLWCKSVTSTQCTLVLPADGTTCNTSKWCQQGSCVTSSNAPALPSTCLYGDSKGLVSTGYTCAGIGTTTPWSCYTHNSSCCETCQSIATGRNGCEYGDKTDCTAITSGAGCYYNQDLCCGTCENYKTGITGCDYGDRGDCTGLTASQCYAGNNTNICCQTCLAYYTGIPGCLYGDKATGCQVTRCSTYSQTNLNSCCYTCYAGTLPTTRGPVTQPLTTQAPVSTTKATVSTVPPETTAWIIPVAATACGIILLLVLVGAICYCQRARKPNKAKAPQRGSSTISRNEFGRARPESFSGIANIAYQAQTVPGTDPYNYISPVNVSGPRLSAISMKKPPPARPPPRRPTQPLSSINSSGGQHPSVIRSAGPHPTPPSSPHEYVEITNYEKLQARPSTMSRAYESLKHPNQGFAKASINAQQFQQYTNDGYNPT
ncbi:A disintegrin and metalloproteinase with thrombospondin motifs 2-like isoform X2 [Mizuhopecten yessoensis]|uniref:A disintegrin and metalloproteinase with thrombospondin motifs 2-like isoform X2 n=1 Tax=Mizuhopecten yessoensis TaxID=6573 RepID=UPI000B45C5B3|nr:A disintegrin and metalloproteinase with thrombospondin motifs 2-like isoform X2 [Mizuhopecten yessoensis]